MWNHNVSDLISIIMSMQTGLKLDTHVYSFQHSSATTG